MQNIWNTQGTSSKQTARETVKKWGRDEHVCQLKMMKNVKAPVLWTKPSEGVEKISSKHGGKLSRSRATRSNKWQRKRPRTSEDITIGRQQRTKSVAQGAKTKMKAFLRF